MERDEEKRFFIDYDGDRYWAYREDGQFVRRSESAWGIEELLQKCKEAGFTDFSGLTREAVDELYDWIARGKPCIEYIENLWDGQSSASRSIGFRLPERE